MQIIRHGKSPNNKTYQFECNACRSVLKATQHEGRLVNDSRDGDAVVFVCPVCSLDVWVAK